MISRKSSKKILFFSSIAMGITLIVSNYLVQFAINEWITWAAFTYPIAFLVTDCTNKLGGKTLAQTIVAIGFGMGVPLSFLFNLYASDASIEAALRISMASGIAFLTANILDVFVFDKLRAQNIWWEAPVLSSMLASIIDTFMFFFIAFAYTEVSWYRLAIGDLGAKVIMIILLLVPYRIITKPSL